MVRLNFHGCSWNANCLRLIAIGLGVMASDAWDRGSAGEWWLGRGESMEDTAELDPKKCEGKYE